MSLIDNLLILLDDGKKRNLDNIIKEFPKHTKQIISATLGRMVSKKLISKKNKKYQITPSSQKNITNYLENIELFNTRKHSNTVTFIMFNIPEKQRIYRDILRNHLVENAYGRLHNTVWIKTDNNITLLKKIIKELNIHRYLTIFKAKIDDPNINLILKNTYWNFDKLNNKYNTFIDKSKSYLKTKSKSKIHARCLVFEFAKIAHQDPLLPEKYYIKYEGFNAFKIKEKISKFCY